MLANQVDPITIGLDKIFLDPNNPRFFPEDRPRTSDDRIDDPGLQDELISKLEKGFAIARLKDSIEENGFLPLDRVVVRQFKENGYVVLEGNRRIAAAKRLYRDHEEERTELSEEVLGSLKRIPALLYKGDDLDAAAWMFQGIRHISGIRDWPAFNKAKLLVDQMRAQRLSLTDAGKLFGVSSQAAGQWERAFCAYEQASEHPDYVEDVDAKLFSFLHEVFGRSVISLREWLQWDNPEKRFSNEERFTEFLGWLYPKFNIEGDFDPDIPGDWENRRIPRAIDLRTVSELITEFKDEFQAFREGRYSLGAAYGKAMAEKEARSEGEEYFTEVFDTFHSELRRLPVLDIKKQGYESRIMEKLDEIQEAINELHEMLKR